MIPIQSDQKELAVLDMLKSLNIEHSHYTHAPAYTMEDCPVPEGTQHAKHCKNIFLCNRQKTDFFLLLIAREKAFKTKEISSQLSVSRLSFASSELLLEKLNLTPGAVSAMALLFDETNSVRVLIDEDIKSWDDIVVHPAVNTASVMLKTKDLIRYIEHVGNEITYVNCT